MHPLYKRLSGEVLWLFLEDHGFGPDECNSLMERFLAEMEENLRVMRKMLADPERVLLLRLPEDETGRGACASCAALHNMLIPASRPDWIEFMPPFGIGCVLRATALSAEAARERSDHRQGAGERVLSAPQRELCCPVFFGGACRA